MQWLSTSFTITALGLFSKTFFHLIFLPKLPVHLTFLLKKVSLLFPTVHRSKRSTCNYARKYVDWSHRPTPIYQFALVSSLSLSDLYPFKGRIPFALSVNAVAHSMLHGQTRRHSYRRESQNI